MQRDVEYEIQAARNEGQGQQDNRNCDCQDGENDFVRLQIQGLKVRAGG